MVKAQVSHSLHRIVIFIFVCVFFAFLKKKKNRHFMIPHQRGSSQTLNCTMLPPKKCANKDGSKTTWEEVVREVRG